MKYVQRKYHIYILCLIAISALVLTACVKKGGDSDNKPTPSASVVQGVTKVPTEGPTPGETEITPTAEPPEAVSPTPEEEIPSPTPAPEDEDDFDDGDDEDDEDDTPEPDEDPEEDDYLEEEETLDYDRIEAWQETFLIWIPEFTEGEFIKAYAEETFDYAEFTGVTRDAVIKYIAAVEEKGFILNAELHDKADTVSYVAENSENWCIVIDFENEELKLGSGFNEEKSAQDKQSEIWATTMLGYLPEFKEGSLSGGGSDGSGSSYAIFDNVSIGYVLEYIDLLEASGYVYEADEGDEDGFIWYNAMNEDELICDLTFYDGVAKLSCLKE